ncbi:MAG: hypothetical protein H7Z37_04735, partial [Pyrinomonadaceae bacterium]|nr:hypothetical protein [Pyrinomonadaceae bacterium]
IESGAKIIPVVNKNSDNLMGKRTGVANPGTITTVLLPPIETANLSRDNDLDALRDKVRTAIAEELARN